MRKQLFVSLLLICLLILPAPVSAAISYDVSLDSIDSIILGNSTYVTESRERIRSQQNQCQKIDGEISMTLSKLYALDKEDPDYESLRDDCLQELDGLYNQKKQAEFDLRILNLTEEAALAEQGQTAKEAYLKYWELAGQLSDLNSKVTKAKKHLLMTEKRYRRGVISKNTWLEEKEGLEDLCEQIPDAEEEISGQRETLQESLGIGGDITLHIELLGEKKETLYAFARNISLEEDLAAVLSHSIELKKAQETVEFYRYQYNNRETYNQAVKEALAVKTKIAKNFRRQYAELQRSLLKIEKDNDKKIRRAESKKKLMWKKYKRGVISKNEYLEAKNTFAEAMKNKEKDMEQQLSAIVKYQLTVKGY